MTFTRIEERKKNIHRYEKKFSFSFPSTLRERLKKIKNENLEKIKEANQFP